MLSIIEIKCFDFLIFYFLRRTPPPPNSSAGPPKNSLSFPSPASIFALFFLSPGVLSWNFLWCFEGRDPQMCTFRPDTTEGAFLYCFYFLSFCFIFFFLIFHSFCFVLCIFVFLIFFAFFIFFKLGGRANPNPKLVSSFWRVTSSQTSNLFGVWRRERR